MVRNEQVACSSHVTSFIAKYATAWSEDCAVVFLFGNRMKKLRFGVYLEFIIVLAFKQKNNEKIRRLSRQQIL